MNSSISPTKLAHVLSPFETTCVILLQNQKALNHHTLHPKVTYDDVQSSFAQAKVALKQANIDFEEIELSGQLQLLEKIKATTGRSSVPQVCTSEQGRTIA